LTVVLATGNIFAKDQPNIIIHAPGIETAKHGQQNILLNLSDVFFFPSLSSSCARFSSFAMRNLCYHDVIVS
jgi:hypothetical protein